MRFNQSQLEAEENEEITIADNHYCSMAPKGGVRGGPQEAGPVGEAPLGMEVGPSTIAHVAPFSQRGPVDVSVLTLLGVLRLQSHA